MGATDGAGGMDGWKDGSDGTGERNGWDRRDGAAAIYFAPLGIIVHSLVRLFTMRNYLSQLSTLWSEIVKLNFSTQVCSLCKRIHIKFVLCQI